MSKELGAKWRRFVEEMDNQGNADVLGELYDEKVIVRRPPMPDIVGLSGFKAARANRHLSFPDEHYAVDEMIAEGNTTIFRCTITGTHTGQSTTIPVPPTGKRGSIGCCMVMHWANGKIVEEWQYVDYLGLFQQLGVIPPMGQGGR